jgi:hypothetical protein
MEGMMKKSSTNPILLFIIVIGICCSSSVFAAVVSVDTLYMENGSGTPGHGGYMFNVYLKNTHIVKAMLFTITDVPDYLTITNVERHVRLSNFRVQTKIEGGAMKIFFMPSAGIPAYLTSGNSAIMRLTVSVASEATGGTQAQLNMTVNSVMDTSNSYVTVAPKNGYFWFGGKGDVKYNGAVDLFDVLAIIDIIIGRTTNPTTYQRWAADINSSKTIDVVDVGLAIDMAVLPPTAANTPLPENTKADLAAGSVAVDFARVPLNYIGKSEVPIHISASAPVSGMHFIFKVNQQKAQIETPYLAQCADHFTMVTKMVNDKMHLFIYSLDGSTLPVGAHDIASIPIFISKPLQDADAIQLESVIAGTDNAQKLQTYFGEKAVEKSSVPETFSLYQNNPNPFNMSTNIMYDVPNTDKAVPVKLNIYNVKGQLIRKLEERTRTGGHYIVQWNGTNDFGEIVSSGIYFCKLVANDVVLTKKLALMK